MGQVFLNHLESLKSVVGTEHRVAVVAQVEADQLHYVLFVVDYQYSKVRTAFAEDRWVKAFEIRPTAPQVVQGWPPRP